MENRKGIKHKVQTTSEITGHKCSQDSKYHCKKVKVQSSIISCFLSLTCLSEITHVYYIYPGERSNSTAYVFVSNTYTWSILYLNSCHAYPQAGLGPYVANRIGTNSWIRAPVKLSKTGWLNCLAWLLCFFMLFTQWSGPVQPNSKNVRHRLSSDNCLDNFYFLSPQNSSSVEVVAQWFAQAVLRPVAGQRLWIGPCHPVCPPIRNCPSLHPCYPLLTLFVFLRAVLKWLKNLEMHLEKYPSLFPAKGWQDIPFCVWTSAAVAAVVSLSIGEQLLQGKIGFPSCGCHTELQTLWGGSQVDAST